MGFLSLTFIYIFFTFNIFPALIFYPCLFVSISLPALFLSLYRHVSLYTPHTPPTHTICLFCSFPDPGAVVETHSAVPYAVIGGVLALLVFTVICVLIVTIWCSVRQKGNTHSNSQTNTPKSTSISFGSGGDKFFNTFFTGTFSHFSTFWCNMLRKNHCRPVTPRFF